MSQLDKTNVELCEKLRDMKKIWFNNPALADLLADNGINLICNENMEIVITEEDAERIPNIIEELALYAKEDFGIEEI